MKNITAVLALLFVAGWTVASAEESLDATRASAVLASVRDLNAGAGGTTVVPMPSAPVQPALSAEQMQKLAAVAASVYQAQGKPWLAKWYCVGDNADKATTTDGSPTQLEHCMKPHGKEKDGNYELSSLELQLKVTGQGTETTLGRDMGSVAVELAELNGDVDGDGSIGKAGWTTHTSWGDGLPDAGATMTHEIDFWMSYKQ